MGGGDGGGVVRFYVEWKHFKKNSKQQVNTQFLLGQDSNVDHGEVTIYIYIYIGVNIR